MVTNKSLSSNDILKSKNLFLYIQISGWLVYFVLGSLLHFTMGRYETPNFYVYHFWESLLGLTTTYLIRRQLIRKAILSQKLSRQIWQLFYLTFIFSIPFSMLSMIFYLITGYYKYAFNYPFTISWLGQWMYCFLLILVWNLLYFSYHYVQKNNREILDNALLQNTVKDLELNTIKAHVNPHFIFNALNSIRALVDENPDGARIAITKLSNLLRSSMQAEKRKTTTLGEEMELVQDYLSLESIRYESRLQKKILISDDVRYQEIPPMTLQTLVENAIKHGISKAINGGLIEIEAYRNEEDCYIIVRNTGKLNPQKDHEGFGIKSTIDRLRLLFGEKAALQLVQQSENTVAATMRIPLYIKA